ncbi:hypothetical protein MMC07_001682 [Pseudocyphellaria aurata]|nr:hypothetical protein [Pseudocyphellaria aurata]
MDEFLVEFCQSTKIPSSTTQTCIPPVIPHRRRRSSIPEELVVHRAQLDALRKTRRDNEMADLRKQIAELQGEQSLRKDEGMDPRFLPLKTRFSAVKAKNFRQIYGNDFDPINITQVKLKDEDAVATDIKGLAVLIGCLGVYFQVELHFAPDEKIRSLSAAFQMYEDHMCKWYSTYTWESVRSFHLNFHQMTINDEVLPIHLYVLPLTRQVENSRTRPHKANQDSEVSIPTPDSASWHRTETPVYKDKWAYTTWRHDHSCGQRAETETEIERFVLYEPRKSLTKNTEFERISRFRPYKVGPGPLGPRGCRSWSYRTETTPPTYKALEACSNTEARKDGEIQTDPGTGAVTITARHQTDQMGDPLDSSVGNVQDKSSGFEQQTKAFGDITAYIQETVAANNTSSIRSEDPHPWNYLRALKGRLAPSDGTRRIEIEQRHHKLCRGPGNQHHGHVLDEWIMTDGKAKKQSMFPSDEMRPPQDSLMAIRSKDASYADARLVGIESGNLLDLRSWGMPKNDISVNGMQEHPSCLC